MKNKTYIPTVTIAIPAFNEEANIGQLLSCLLAQKEVGFVLKKIMVTSDKSTDNTAREVRKIKSKKIEFKVNTIRRGQALSQNAMAKRNTSDIFIVLNADIFIIDNHFIQKLIAPILKNKKVGIVSPQIVPLPAESFFERAINYSVQVKNAIYTQVKNGNNIYMCHGRARAFSKDFLKKLYWRRVSSEDAFSYLVCIQKGFEFVFQPKTKVFYKSPINFRDHRLQSGRFLKSMTELDRYFDRDFIKREYYLPVQSILISGIKYFFINPIYTLTYLTLLVFIKFLGNIQLTSMWEIAESSKKLSKTTL